MSYTRRRTRSSCYNAQVFFSQICQSSCVWETESARFGVSLLS